MLIQDTGYLPFKYHADFIDYLADHPKWFEVITYDDMKWQDGDDDLALYPLEQRAWEASVAHGDIDPKKIYVLIQHDVDSQPQRTMQLLRHELDRNVRSNVMIFNRRIDRRHYVATGIVNYTPYAIDVELMQDAQSRGFVIGYHMNAYEQAGYDPARAVEIFRQDIEELSQHFDIKYFSAHGGAPGPEGINNRDLQIDLKQSGLIWVHNGKTPRFASTYSDGGINSAKRDPDSRDLREFVKKWVPGRRYRVLTHPQYYHHKIQPAPRLMHAAWYKEVTGGYQSTVQLNAWRDVFPLSERESKTGNHLLTRLKRLLQPQAK